jgi:hypothetical protein
VATDPKKVKAISTWPKLENVTQLRSFLGLTEYYRKFIKDYLYISRPLFQALKKDNFVWTEEQTNAFQKLKHSMTHSLS